MICKKPLRFVHEEPDAASMEASWKHTGKAKPSQVDLDIIARDAKALKDTHSLSTRLWTLPKATI